MKSPRSGRLRWPNKSVTSSPLSHAQHQPKGDTDYDCLSATKWLTSTNERLAMMHTWGPVNGQASKKSIYCVIHGTRMMWSFSLEDDDLK